MGPSCKDVTTLGTQESTVGAWQREDRYADVNVIFPLIGLCTYCACASLTQLIAQDYSLGFLLSHSASHTLQFKAPYFNFMTEQSVAKSSLLSASVIPAHFILASPVLSSLHTDCPSSFMFRTPKFPLQIPLPPSHSCLCLHLEVNPLPSVYSWFLGYPQMGMKKAREIRNSWWGKKEAGEEGVPWCAHVYNFCPVER